MMPSHLPQEILVLNSVSTHCADSAVWSVSVGKRAVYRAAYNWHGPGANSVQIGDLRALYGERGWHVRMYLGCSVTPKASNVNSEPLLHDAINLQ